MNDEYEYEYEYTLPNAPRKQRETYQEYRYTRLKFGKYKGRFLSEIPEDYLKWAIKTLDKYQATMFATELQRREKEKK